MVKIPRYDKILPVVRYHGDADKAKRHRGEALHVLNRLRIQRSFQNLDQDVLRRKLGGGVEVVTHYVMNTPYIDIYAPFVEKIKVEEKIIYIKKPVILVAVGYYAPLFVPTTEAINPYIDYFTYPYKVMLYDVEENSVIETNMTTTELKERHGIDVWHPDALTGISTDKGLRLPDDMNHEKSYPLSRYLINMEGFLGDGYVYAHGAHENPVVSWGADSTPPPLPPTAPTVPSSITGACHWNTPKHENSNRNEVVVDTKETGVEAINSHTRYRYYEQGAPAFCNAKLCPSCAGCPSETTGSIYILPAAWLVSFMTKCGCPADRRIFENYSRFGGSYRLTTRDEYPSLITGCVGYIQTKYDDYQDQASHIVGGGGSPASICHPPCPTYIYSYERTINIIVECSFGELYTIEFSHGTYNYWTCGWAGTQGSDGEAFQFPGNQQAFIGLEAGIIDSKVVSVATVVAGTERIAWPYIGTYGSPGRWSSADAYDESKVQKVRAGINVTELDENLEYVPRIMSANDIDYFSLSVAEGNSFETAVNELVEEYYKRHPEDGKYYVDPRICIETRVIVQHIEKETEKIVGYSSCDEPNPWITP